MKRLLILAVLVILATLFVPAGLALAQGEEIPPLPAAYYGAVEYTNGQAVAAGTVEAYVDGQKRGELSFMNGLYGGPEGCQKKLIVQGPSEIFDRPVTFMVVVNNQSYPAQPNPAVNLISGDVKRVDLKIPPVIIVKGYVYLEKVQPSDPEPDHQGTLVKATQGGNVFDTVESGSSGYYEIASLAPSTAYQVEFTHPGASWKKEVRSGTTPAASGFLELPKVTLYLGDMDQNGAINILDLLWMAARIGPVTTASQIADVKKDGTVNILDLLRVANNIGK